MDPNEQEPVDYIFKIILMGDGGVGKSSLMKRFCQNHFDINSRTTLGIEFMYKNIKIDNKTIKCQIWDTAGQERFRSVTSAYYRGAVGGLMVYDMTNKKSFENIQRWVNEMQNHSDPNLQVMLVGNKLDLRKYSSVSTNEGKDLAEKLNYSFMETSALDATNVEKCVDQVVKNIYQEIISQSVKSQGEMKRRGKFRDLKNPGKGTELTTADLKQESKFDVSNCCSSL